MERCVVEGHIEEKYIFLGRFGFDRMDREECRRHIFHSAFRQPRLGKTFGDAFGIRAFETTEGRGVQALRSGEGA